MVCEYVDQVYGNDWCTVANTYCSPGKECYFDHIHQTNADRIRAMSDEELAEFLCGVYDEDEDAAKFINGVYIPCYDQYSIKEWLKQPVEE